MLYYSYPISISPYPIYMANIRSGNTFYVDSSSSTSSAGSFITESNLKLIGVVFHVGAATDEIDVYTLSSTSSAAGNKKLVLKRATAGDTYQLRFADAPIVFPNGVWVSVTGAPIATLIFTQQGSN